MNQEKQLAYLVVDIGTGNARVATVLTDGKIVALRRENVHYEQDADYPDAISFDPACLWGQIIRMSQQVLQETENLDIIAITATSQREGIVVFGPDESELIGMSNHDNRGREWEDMIKDKSAMYKVAGRYPTALFSALKLVGFRERKVEAGKKITAFTSISDWVNFKFSGILAYEHSQASETLLYDVKRGEWEAAYGNLFGISPALLPPLKVAGTVLGPLRSQLALELNINPKARVIVGGSDTQMAIKSVLPNTDDVVIVSGTTTPVVKIVDNYLVDASERTWTSRHIDDHYFVLEANAGVTGLNYQRLKEIFYPNEDYEVIEEELNKVSQPQCIASLGSLIADEKSPLTKGGFIFNAPVSHQLTRGDFVWAILWDIACSIYENYKTLDQVSGHSKDYVLACGGGVQSKTLRQFLANLFNKKIIIRDTYRQSSIIGAALICTEALQTVSYETHVLDTSVPRERERYLALYEEWSKVRKTFKQVK